MTITLLIGPWLTVAARAAPLPAGARTTADTEPIRAAAVASSTDDRSSNADFGIVTEDKNLSPLTCFFASSEFELNKEYHSSTLNCGSLSYALSKAITESNTKTTYAALFDRVKNIMNSIVPGQTPHIEGEYNQEVFGGNIQEQAKYLKISKIESSKIVKIDGGLLSSFTENSIVGFYPPDTRDYRTATPYIKGKIIYLER